MRRSTLAFVLLTPATIIMVALLVLPVGYLIRFSLFEGQGSIQDLGGFTLANYAKLFNDTFYLGILDRLAVISHNRHLGFHGLFARAFHVAGAKTVARGLDHSRAVTALG